MVLVKYRKKTGDTANTSATTSFAHLILCGSSSWALRHTAYTENPLMLATFGFLFGHSILGTVNYSHPDASDNLQIVYEHSQLMADVVPIAFTTAGLYQMLGPEKLLFDPNLNYLHLVTVVFPMVANYCFNDYLDYVVDAVVFGNLCSLSYLAMKHESPWVWGLIALTGLNHGIFRRFASNFDVPKVEVVTVGLSFFCIFAVNCICDCKL